MDMSEAHEPSLREAISGISGRLPQYGKLSASLVQEGWMRAPQRSPLTSLLGTSGFSKLTRWVPLLPQINKVLVTISAIRFALDEMQPDKADRHLEAAGLTREQVENDFQTISTLSRRYASDGARIAGEKAHEGFRQAGRAAGKGLRALDRWRKNR